MSVSFYTLATANVTTALSAKYIMVPLYMEGWISILKIIHLDYLYVEDYIASAES